MLGGGGAVKEWHCKCICNQAIKRYDPQPQQQQQQGQLLLLWGNKMQQTYLREQQQQRRHMASMSVLAVLLLCCSPAFGLRPNEIKNECQGRT